MVIILTPLSLLVLVSVGTMTLRWFYQILFTGMTQIESWEYERIESQIGTTRFWNIIQKNYKSIYGKDLKSVSSWSSSHRMVRDLNDDDSNPFFTIDDLVFPYDINPWANLLDAFGSPWNWLFFWGKPVGDGLYFRKNEFADDTGEDELNSLPWPPDAGHDEITIGGFNSDDSHVPLNDEKSGTRTARNRTDWFNSYGERLSDFGVDTENEEVTINRDQGLSSGVDST
jgi:palmitoyltransferase